MNVKNAITAVVALMLFAAIPYVAAETETGMILVSDTNADCAVAETLADESGATIITTVWGDFEQSVIDSIIETSPEEVIIIGGPMAVVEGYETQLEENGINVTRLGGQTRQQTSLTVFNQYRNRYNWSATLGDGTEPYRAAGKFPVWYFDDETEIDNFIKQHNATVLNYGKTERFAGRHGTSEIDISSDELQNFQIQLRDRIHTQYADQSETRNRSIGQGADLTGK